MDWKTSPTLRAGGLVSATVPPSPSTQPEAVQLASQPNVAGPSRSKNVELHAPRPQEPAEQLAGAFNGAGHTRPHSPQLAGSFAVSGAPEPEGAHASRPPSL